MNEDIKTLIEAATKWANYLEEGDDYDKDEVDQIDKAIVNVSKESVSGPR